MAKSFQKSSVYFDQDLDAILNRVYGSTSSNHVDRGPSSIPQSFPNHQQGSQELKQALAALRDRRERAQSAMRLKEEVDYLRQQIDVLRNLGDQIDRLRQQIDHEAERQANLG